MFDFMKKGPSKNKTAPEPQKTTKDATKKVEGNDFATQEESLKPKDEKGKKGGGLGGVLATVRDNIDKSSLGKVFGSPGWYKNQWQGVEDAVKLIPLNGTGLKFVMLHHRDALRAFCVKQYSQENLDLYEAVTEGVVNGQGLSKQAIYENYLALGAGSEANFPQNLLTTLHELANKGEHSKMDFSGLVATAMQNLMDPFYRFTFDDELKRVLFHKMTGVKSPNKVGGVKGE